MAEHTETSQAVGAAQSTATHPLSAQYASAVHSRTSELVGRLEQLSAQQAGLVDHDLLESLKKRLAVSQRETDAAQKFATANRENAPESEAATTARKKEASAAARVVAIGDEVQQALIDRLASVPGAWTQAGTGRVATPSGDGQTGRLGGLEALTAAVTQIGQRQPAPLDENQKRINAEMAARRQRAGDPGRQPDPGKQQAVVAAIDGLIKGL